jgi:hypothetical protein
VIVARKIGRRRRRLPEDDERSPGETPVKRNARGVARGRVSIAPPMRAKETSRAEAGSFPRMNATILMGLASALVATACSSSSSPGGSGDDGGAASDALEAIDSSCGQVGDQGNSLGVGKFCQNFSDCAGTSQSHLCSIIGDDTTHFCTFICTAPPADAGAEGGADVDSGYSPDECGTGATCTCGNGGCGCTPNICLSP